MVSFLVENAPMILMYHIWLFWPSIVWLCDIRWYFGRTIFIIYHWFTTVSPIWKTVSPIWKKKSLSLHLFQAIINQHTWNLIFIVWKYSFWIVLIQMRLICCRTNSSAREVSSVSGYMDCFFNVISTLLIKHPHCKFICPADLYSKRFKMLLIFHHPMCFDHLDDSKLKLP